jgi:hypothetical protein
MLSTTGEFKRSNLRNTARRPKLTKHGLQAVSLAILEVGRRMKDQNLFVALWIPGPMSRLARDTSCRVQCDVRMRRIKIDRLSTPHRPQRQTG